MHTTVCIQTEIRDGDSGSQRPHSNAQVRF